MLIIRLTRQGRSKLPFYHLVVAEKSRAVQKRFVAKLGYYNPLHEGGKGEVVFDQEKTAFYIKNGAQMSQSAARLLSKAGLKDAGKFIKARASKPKKEAPAPKEEAPAMEENTEVSSPDEGAETPTEETNAPESSE